VMQDTREVHADAPPRPVHRDRDVRLALMMATGPDGAWPRLPQSARHDPVAWSACRFLADEGLAEPTGDVRGDRTQFRSTERGRAVCASMLAIQVAKPLKPKVRVPATAVEAPPANPTHPARGGSG
jgi:hypothetical protein